MDSKKQSKDKPVNNKETKKDAEEAFINIFDLQPEPEKKEVKQVEKQLKPEPMADPKLAKKIFDMLQQLLPLKQVRKGVN